jgi:hypothetical protein
MDIRYVYIRPNGAGPGESPWLNGYGPDNLESRSLFHASQVARGPILVVARDASTGYMVPLAMAAASGKTTS